MFINSIGYYVPEQRISNDYFSRLHNLDEEWYVKRTGITSRARASEEEDVTCLCAKAVKKALPTLPYAIEEVDLIVFASYTPTDTVATTGHILQRDFRIEKAKVFYLSSACSSAINAIEVIRTFLHTNIASKALLICADKNSYYSHDTDQQSGHLWGDAATAFFFSKTAFGQNDTKLLDVHTQGLGHIGYGPGGVSLDPKTTGIQMPHGKDVFTQACTYMALFTSNILARNNYTINDLSFFIGHQANKRILMHVCESLHIPEHKSLSNIEELGNTGCTSALLVFAQNQEKFQPNNLVCLSVFGGGYSAGTCLLQTH
jgi:3-oxoacyl-[acyl-carrier-protein] synthase-3